MMRGAVNIGGALLLLTLLWSSTGNALAAKSWSFSEPHDHNNPYIEEQEWQEVEGGLPDYPDEATLLEVDLGQANDRFRYLLDPASLSVGDDGVVRYTLVLQSTSGARNLMYEGMRCSAPFYKTYAYGSRDRSFRPLKTTRWREIGITANTRYRDRLRKLYFCDMSGASTNGTRTARQILDAIKYSRQGEQSYSQ